MLSTTTMLICQLPALSQDQATSLDLHHGHQSPYTYYGINMNSRQHRQILWTNTVQAPAGNISVAAGPADPTADGGHGVFTEAYKETMQWVGYSMSTGAKLWGPTAPIAPLDYYGNPQFRSSEASQLTENSTPQATQEYSTAGT